MVNKPRVRTKAATNIQIIATFRPEQVRSKAFASYLKAGVSIVRLNASHCDLAELHYLASILKDYPVQVMLDLPGPECRLFGFDSPIPLRKGQVLQVGSEAGMLRTSFPRIGDLHQGEPVLLMNGEIQGYVVNVSSAGFSIQIQTTGTLRQNAHITFPHWEGELPYPTQRDIELIGLACELRWHYLALSMLDSARDVMTVKNHIATVSPGFSPLLAAKIETLPALKNMREIIQAADAVFVARGDLGVRIEPQSMPIVQKEITSAGVELGTPVFIATQMLSSMTQNPIPTRAEASDVANAVFDGASGITLSEETAIGANPLQVIKMASSIVREAQEYANRQTHTAVALFPDSSIPITPAMDKLLTQVGLIGSLIWTRGWAEANAGNISIRVDDLIPARHRKNFHWYLVSRSGSRYRQIADDPLHDLVLVADDGSRWEAISGTGKPTSEWESHLALQRWALANDKPEKVVLHTHPEPIVTLGNLDIYADEAGLNRTLAVLLPELPIYLPEGIACCPLFPPGSSELAKGTMDCVPRSRVIIWQKHGILCRGTDLDTAFDLMEIVAKAASVYLAMLASKQELS